MKPGWIVAILMLFLVFQIVAGICEMAYLPKGVASDFETLLKPEFTAGYTNLLLNTFWGVLTWDAPFWYDASGDPNGFMIIRFFFFAISVGIIFVIFTKAPLQTAVAGAVLGVSTFVSSLFS